MKLSKIATLPFLILATPLAAQSDSNQIVVTGTPIEDSARALADCLARGCSPEEDITLTLAHAENQFVAGEYKDGDQTLNKSISRNKKHKAEVPELLAGLYRASARFSEHLGEPSDFKFATLNMRDTLRDVFGEDDRRVLIAQTEVGDSRAKLGSLRDAQSIYTAVEQRALELNYPRVASFARLRQALLQQVKWSDGKQSSRALMNYKAALTQLITEPLPNSDDFSLVAQVLQARLLRELEKPEATDQLIATFLAKGGTEKPILLYNEPFESITESLFSENSRFRDRRSNTLARLTTPQLNRPRYIDIGFWIRPDGTTAEVEILREQGTNDWHGSVLAQIASRRYAPLKLDATSPGLFHIERYTQTARFTERSTGTRLRRREPVFRVERLDLTPESYESALDEQG